MSSQSNHNKIKDLLVATIVFVPCLLILANTVSEESKKVMKPGIMKCEELETGDRGYIRGIVTERKQSRWNWNQEATLAESNSCSTIVTFSPNDKAAGFFRPGAKLKVAVKVDSEYSASLLNSDVKRDYTILNLNGTANPTQTIVKTLSRGILPRKGNNWQLNFNYGLGDSFYFPKEVVAKLKADVPMRWYYQEQSPKFFIVSDVELVEN